MPNFRAHLALALAAGAVLAVAATAPVVAAETAPKPAPSGPQPALPLSLPMKLGAFDIYTLRDAEFASPVDGKTFGVGIDPAEIQKVLDSRSTKKGRGIKLSVDALLVKMPGHLALFDTGLGPKANGSLIGSLALAGFKPADVTDIFITHSHGDHIGGLLDAQGKPAFPNAVVRFSAPEWDYLRGQPVAEALVKAIGDKVKPIPADGEVIPGVRAVFTVGHTPGHTAYEIHSGNAKLYDIGDLAHSSIISLAKPDWVMGFDGDAKAGAAMRRAQLARLAGNGEWVFAPHFPFPGTGRVARAGDGFIWKPAQK